MKSRLSQLITAIFFISLSANVLASDWDNPDMMKDESHGFVFTGTIGGIDGMTDAEAARAARLANPSSTPAPTASYYTPTYSQPTTDYGAQSQAVTPAPSTASAPQSTVCTLYAQTKDGKLQCMNAALANNPTSITQYACWNYDYQKWIWTIIPECN